MDAPTRWLSVEDRGDVCPSHSCFRSEGSECPHQLARRAWLESRMPGIIDDAQFRAGPGAMQVPRAAHGADDVVATLDNDRRNSPDGADAVEQLPLSQEAAIHEVVALDARQHRGKANPRRRCNLCAARQQVAGCALP